MTELSADSARVLGASDAAEWYSTRTQTQPASERKFLRVRDAERAAIAGYLQRQRTMLLSRHPVDDVIVLHVLADHHQRVALIAREGDLDAASAEMRALDRVPRPGGHELELIYALSAVPVSSLLRWRYGAGDEAQELMTKSLAIARELVVEFGHDYLTAKRLHLAANLARVDATNGRCDEALAAARALRSVMTGRCDLWRWGAADQLRVPLSGAEHETIAHQLTRIEQVARLERGHCRPMPAGSR